ncbi:MAG: hypothetical protein WDO74_04805 [Pseudomonadota bacterium]
MEKLFQRLTELAVAPFELADALADPPGALRSAGVADADLALGLGAIPLEANIAGGAWDPCTTCVDPGGDRDYDGP